MISPQFAANPSAQRGPVAPGANPGLNALTGGQMRQVQQYAMGNGLANGQGQITNPGGVYDAAKRFGLSAGQVDQAGGFAGGTAANWIRQNGAGQLGGGQGFLQGQGQGQSTPLNLGAQSGMPNQATLDQQNQMQPALPPQPGMPPAQVRSPPPFQQPPQGLGGLQNQMMRMNQQQGAMTPVGAGWNQRRQPQPIRQGPIVSNAFNQS